MAKKRKTVRRQAPSRAHEGEGQLRVVTTEQLEAILNVLNMLIRQRPGREQSTYQRGCGT